MQCDFFQSCGVFLWGGCSVIFSYFLFKFFLLDKVRLNLRSKTDYKKYLESINQWELEK